MNARTNLYRRFAVCFLVSLGVAIPSYGSMIFYEICRAIHGGYCPSPSLLRILLTLAGMIAPFIIFPIGAFRSRQDLSDLPLSQIRRAIWFTVFALFPLVLVLLCFVARALLSTSS